jgi:BirA family biotin operon repressor/biotin-[acetyl-CoA-carboxylase] ligase
LVAGVAVTCALERLRFSCEVKWPNDVLINGRKVCGILCESEGKQVVFGIGVNVSLRKMPESLSGIATSLALESGECPTREELLLDIRSEIRALVQLAERNFADVIAMARERCALSGKMIHYTVGEQRYHSHCEGIGEGGELLVRREGQIQRILSAEEIRIAE